MCNLLQRKAFRIIATVNELMVKVFCPAAGVSLLFTPGGCNLLLLTILYLLVQYYVIRGLQKKELLNMPYMTKVKD